jgi:hypothetical protein
VTGGTPGGTTFATVAQRTRALLAPPSPGTRLADGTAVRERLAAAISPLAEGMPGGRQVVVSVPTLRQALVDPARLAAPEETFRWKPAFARRSLGLAVVEACASGRFRAPAEAVGPIVQEAVAEWDRTGWRTYHWEPWLAGLPMGARAVVLADAVGWATGLWSSLDWRSLVPEVQFGATYEQWVSPAAPTVRLKARPDLRVPLAASAPAGPSDQMGEGGVALVSVCGGCPAPGWADELAFLALVSIVGSTSRPAPVRVLGLWPEAGIHRVLNIDDVALARATDRVAVALSAVVEARASGVACP